MEASLRQFQVSFRRFLRLLNKAVEQNHLAITGCKNDAGNMVWQSGTNLPQTFVKLPDKRHPKGPAELYRFDVLADYPSIPTG